MNYAYNEDLMLSSIAAYRKEQRALAAARAAATPVAVPAKMPPQRAAAPSTQAAPIAPPTPARALRHEPRLTVNQILGVVASSFALTPDKLRSHNRAYAIVRPRQLAMMLLRECNDMTFGQIARVFDAHHTTVIHAIRVAEARCLVDRRLQAVRDRVRSAATERRAA